MASSMTVFSSASLEEAGLSFLPSSACSSAVRRIPTDALGDRPALFASIAVSTPTPVPTPV